MWDEYIDAPTPFIPVWEVGKTDTPVWRMTEDEARPWVEKGFIRFKDVGEFPIVHIEHAENGAVKALFLSATPSRDFRN